MYQQPKQYQEIYIKDSLLYFYLIPAFMIAMLYAYTALESRTANLKKVKDEVAERNLRVRQRNENNRLGRDYVMAARSGRKPSVEEVAKFHEMLPDGCINICAAPGAVATASSRFQGSDKYCASNAIDGNTSFVADDASITVTDVAPAPAWVQVDFPNKQSATVVQVKIYAPQPASDVGFLTNFKVSLLNERGVVVANKSFFTDGKVAPAIIHWDLVPPLHASSVRVESLDSAHGLSITEIEVATPN